LLASVRRNVVNDVVREEILHNVQSSLF
jgi:hypothetical protein